MARQLTACGYFNQGGHRFNNPSNSVANGITSGGLGHEFVKLLSCFHIALEQTVGPRWIAREQVQLLPRVLCVLGDHARRRMNCAVASRRVRPGRASAF